MGHFRVQLLFVSVSKRVLVLNYCKGDGFDLHKNTQLTRTRFETEACSNSEMGY